MQTRGVKRYGLVLLATMIASVLCVLPVMAETSESPSYQATELQFGSDSHKQACSAQFCATTSIGDAAVGETTGGASTAEFGSITSDEPLLEVIVDPGEAHLGELTTETTARRTMLVRVRSHLSFGYTIHIAGNPPSYTNHLLTALSEPTASTPGSEQFGINVVDNTTPDIGALPIRIPSNETDAGSIMSGYETSDLFMYEDGDAVVHNTSGSGRTDYTISFIANISNVTPAGNYSGDFAAIVVPVY